MLPAIAVRMSFPNYSPIAQFKTLQDLSLARLHSRIIFGQLRVDHGLTGSNRQFRKLCIMKLSHFRGSLQSVTDISSSHEKIRSCTASNKFWVSERQWAVIEL
jgi:hypothetical protein